MSAMDRPDRPDRPERWGVLVLHPSRHEQARAVVSALGHRLAEEAPGFVLWTLGTPTDAAAAHARRAPRGARFQIVPLLLAPGAHFHEDVNALALQLGQAAPSLDIHVAPALLERGGFLSWLLGTLRGETGDPPA